MAGFDEGIHRWRVARPCACATGVEEVRRLVAGASNFRTWMKGRKNFVLVRNPTTAENRTVCGCVAGGFVHRGRQA